jgi:hypothetical protein
MFLQKQDAEIAKILWDYFRAVEIRWPEAWRHTSEGNILNRTTGFAALMKFLRDAYLSVATPGSLVPAERFVEIFERIGLADAEFNSRAYKTGSGGEAALYKHFLELSNLGNDAV